MMLTEPFRNPMEVLRDACQCQVGVKRFKGKKNLSIVPVKFNFAIWDDIRHIIYVKDNQ